MGLIEYPEYPNLKGSEKNIFTLTDDYLIKGVCIPAGTPTDGLTLKVRILKLIVDKYSPKYSPFFALHDFLCRKDEYKKADRLGREVLLEIENSFKTKAMMFLVELYHKIKYRRFYE